jgi:hypothetical protein
LLSGAADRRGLQLFVFAGPGLPGFVFSGSGALMSKIHFTLYSRSYCHLCEDMLQALLALRAPDENDAGWFAVEVIDVDDHPELVAKYDELVPVLSGSKDGRAPIQLCHYFLDAGSVRKFLNEGD